MGLWKKLFGRHSERSGGQKRAIHGAPSGQMFSCEACGAKMQKLGSGKGHIMLSREETFQHIGPAEECHICGRVYCGQCYPSRPNVCLCGQGIGSVTEIDGVIYKGSLRLIKVRYFD